MIYLNKLDSIIESVYLEDRLSMKMIACDVFVNPDNIKYLTGKTVVISINDYKSEDIDTLLRNRNKVISRVYIDRDDVEVQPYLIRVNQNLMWNGKSIDRFQGLNKLLLDGDCEFTERSGMLYFPKIETFEENDVRDQYGNLTCLGWALHQAGKNLNMNTPFVNLDVIKLKKMVI